MRGRKPKPLAQQIAEGDPRKRGVHRLQEALERMPQAERGLPPCPAHLKGLGRTAWDVFKANLESMNQAFRPDAIMLEGLCIAYAFAREAEALLARDGLIV